MVDSKIVDILRHHGNGLTIREIMDRLLPEEYEYNFLSTSCHNMVTRGLLIRDRNEHEIFTYRLADRSNIRIPPPEQDSNVKVTSYLDDL